MLMVSVAVFFQVKESLKKKSHWDFPGGAVVKNPPANAGENKLVSWSGKIPHATEQLSPCTTTTEPVL